MAHKFVQLLAVYLKQKLRMQFGLKLKLVAFVESSLAILSSKVHMHLISDLEIPLIGI